MALASILNPFAPVIHALLFPDIYIETGIRSSLVAGNQFSDYTPMHVPPASYG